MAAPVVYGPAYSTYTRTARLALEEKGVDYKLEEVDILTGAGQSPAHLARQPFGQVPAFEHEGIKLYESGAITRYIDEVFPGPKLQPADPKRRARMMQFIRSTGLPIKSKLNTGVWELKVKLESESYMRQPAKSGQIGSGRV